MPITRPTPSLLSPQALASIPPDRIADAIFQPHPAARVVSSNHPAVTIFIANRGSEAVSRIDKTGPESALITRPALDVMVRHLPPGAEIFLACLLAGEPFGTAAATASGRCLGFDLTSSIVVAFEAGTFTAIRNGD